MNERYACVLLIPSRLNARHKIYVIHYMTQKLNSPFIVLLVTMHMKYPASNSCSRELISIRARGTPLDDKNLNPPHPQWNTFTNPANHVNGCVIVFKSRRGKTLWIKVPPTLQVSPCGLWLISWGPYGDLFRLKERHARQEMLKRHGNFPFSATRRREGIVVYECTSHPSNIKVSN